MVTMTEKWRVSDGRVTSAAEIVSHLPQWEIQAIATDLTSKSSSEPSANFLLEWSRWSQEHGLETD